MWWYPNVLIVASENLCRENCKVNLSLTWKLEMIQISQTTANYLLDAGNSDWFEARDDVVKAKGKGEIQTYWLFIDGKKTDDIVI